MGILSMWWAFFLFVSTTCSAGFFFCALLVSTLAKIVIAWFGRYLSVTLEELWMQLGVKYYSSRCCTWPRFGVLIKANRLSLIMHWKCTFIKYNKILYLALRFVLAKYYAEIQFIINQRLAILISGRQSLKILCSYCCFWLAHEWQLKWAWNLLYTYLTMYRYTYLRMHLFTYLPTYLPTYQPNYLLLEE